MQSNSTRERLERDGFAIVRGVIGARDAAALIDRLSLVGESPAVRAKGHSRYGVRQLCRLVPEVATLARSEAIRSLLRNLCGDRARPVRSLLFDKTAEANWKVPWHQDLTIAVRKRRDVDGFGPWSVKAGVAHVQPPAPVLERMMTIRLHLDDCGEENGPLRVVPGSHRMGFLDSESARRVRQERGEVTCAVSRGDALLMRPLLLHTSSAAKTPGHRRVIHLEFATNSLPGGLEWHE